MENKSGKTLSTIAMVLGIVSVVFAWLGWLTLLGLVCGIVAIVLAVKGKKASVEAGEPTGMATAGLVLGIIGVVLSGIMVICIVACGSLSCAVLNATDVDPEIGSDVQDFFNSLQ